jgi:hypothetical protein
MLLLMHTSKRKGRLVAQDQNEVTMMDRIIDSDLLTCIGGIQLKRSLPVDGVVKIGEDSITFSRTSGRQTDYLGNRVC